MKKLLLALTALFTLTLAQAQVVPAPPGTAAMVCANNAVIPPPTSGQFFYVQCDSSGHLLTNAGSGAGASINIASYLNTTQLAAAQGGANTVDMTVALNTAITACNTATRCKLYAPAGYYYTSTCNLTALTAAFSLIGDGSRSLDGTQVISVIACGANSVPLFTINPMIGLFRDIALISVGFTPSSGSSAVLVTNGISNNLQKVDFESIQVDGFYDSVDVRVGNSWHLINSVLQNCVHWCVRVQNTVLADAGDWTVGFNNIYPAQGGLAAVRMESSGGAKIIGNQIVSNSGTIVDCINVDTTGHVSEQIEISSNKCEGATGIPINVVRGWAQMKINNNTLKSSVSNIVNPAIFCSICSNMIIEGNALQGSGNAITLQQANLVTIGCNQSNFNNLLLNTSPVGKVTVDTACNLNPVTYQGPGDIKAGATAWWGLRAYSLASAGGNAAVICNAGDANCVTINTLANGVLDVATTIASPLLCAGAGAPCTIKQLYDQTNGTACAGSPCHIINNTAASRPVYTPNCVGSLPCITSSTATSFMATSGVSSIPQPFTITAMAKRTGNFSSYNAILSNAGSTVALYLHTANNADFFVTTDNNFAATDSVWHTLQAIGNGSSSSGTTDGSTTALAGAAGTAFTSAALMRAFNDAVAPGDAMVGTITEFGVWSSAFSAADLASMNSNMHAFWSF